MVNLVVVDHSFIEESYRRRWEFLAERHPVDVTLLVPKVWKTEWFGEEITYRLEREERRNYRVLPLPTTSKRAWMKYFFLSPDAQFRSIEPDIVHVQYAEMALIHHQLIQYKKLWARDAKYTFFTMNALGVPQEKLHQRVRWEHLRRNADAAFGHYPGCRDSLRAAAFNKPIYLQTSYGVDETIFYPDYDDRRTVRESLGYDDRFVIGYVGRLTPEKGVDDLLDVLPLDGVDWSLLLVGDGEMRPEIQRTVERNGWNDRVHLTGYVPQEKVPKYLRAMDSFVLGSKTTDEWIDTFPRSIVQAMACQVPVIGSDSGAIPFQINDSGLIFPEGNISELRDRLTELATDPELRADLGEAGRQESVGRFGQKTLADNFYKVIKQLQTGDIRYNENNERSQYKAY